MSQHKFLFLNNLLTAAINFLVVVALFIAMYRASLYPDNFNVTVFETFFSLLVPAVLLGICGKQYLRRRRPRTSADIAPVSYDL